MNKTRNFFIRVAAQSVLAMLCVVSAAAFGTDPADWPKEIVVDGERVVMYQPQPEKLEGNLLESRAAVSVEDVEDNGPVFGAVWFSTRLETDRDYRMATITDVRVLEVRFPGQEEDDVRRLRSLLEREMPLWDLKIDMDRLAATLELAEKREIAAEQINTAPPRILFVPGPAVLVTIDGEPRLKKVDDSDLMRVINTSFTLLFSPADNRYYLYAGKETWYVARELTGNWSILEVVPPQVAVWKPGPGDASEEVDPKEWERIQPGPPPVIYVSTEPAELISSSGEPEFTPIGGTSLLYMSNTDSDVLMYIPEQRYYVLLAGRWYGSVSLNGPWEYVAGEDLPPDFSRIPEDSRMGTVLYAVPGTEVAREAVLDAYVPQTAAIDRNKATLTVEYDGKPEFARINSTDLYYAVNTAIPVIWTGRWYYACDQGVWFVAPAPKGPWTVAISVPDAVYLIPPQSPVYNVTFVRVYRATPQVVYVGYTPGYTHTYVYNNTIVYGTGHYWPGWYGRYYYPRPCTWGHHVRWDPWSGWAFGISYSTSPYYFAVGRGGWYRGGWWGPAYYRGYGYGYYHRYRRVKHVEYRVKVPEPREVNIYRSKYNKVRLTTDIRDRPILWNKKSVGVSPRENNVFVDRDGNVHRRTDKGWQKRTKDQWQRHETVRPLETRPVREPVPFSKQGKVSGRPTEPTRSPTGPIPVKKPWKEREEAMERERVIVPAPMQPSKQREQRIRTEPVTGPVPTQKPHKQRERKVEREPATAPVPMHQPVKQRERGMRPEPSPGPVPEKQPVKIRREWDPRHAGSYQLDQSYKAREQGEERARSNREFRDQGKGAFPGNMPSNSPGNRPDSRWGGKGR